MSVPRFYWNVLKDAASHIVKGAGEHIGVSAGLAFAAYLAGVVFFSGSGQGVNETTFAQSLVGLAVLTVAWFSVQLVIAPVRVAQRIPLAGEQREESVADQFHELHEKGEKLLARFESDPAWTQAHVQQAVHIHRDEVRKLALDAAPEFLTWLSEIPIGGPGGASLDVIRPAFETYLSRVAEAEAILRAREPGGFGGPDRTKRLLLLDMLLDMPRRAEAEWANGRILPNPNPGQPTPDVPPDLTNERVQAWLAELEALVRAALPERQADSFLGKDDPDGEFDVQDGVDKAQASRMLGLREVGLRELIEQIDQVSIRPTFDPYRFDACKGES